MSRPTSGPGAARPRITSTARLLQRFVASDLRAAIVLVLVTVLAAGLLTMWPRALERVSGAVLEEAIHETSSSTRDLTASAVLFGYGPGPEGRTQLEGGTADLLGAIDSDLQGLRAALPRPLAGLVGEGRFEKVSIEIPIGRSAESDVRFPQVQLVTDPFLKGQVDLTVGRWPERVSGYGSDEFDFSDEYIGWIDPDEPIEVALEESSAARLGWEVGQTRAADAFMLPSLELVGTYSVRDADDGYWSHSTLGVGPRIIDDPDQGISVTAAAHVPALTYAQLEQFPLGTKTNFWFPLAPAEMAFSDVPVLTSQLRGFTAARHDVQGSVTFSSELLETLDSVVREVGALRSAVAFLASGALAAIVAVLLASAQTMQDRRRRELALLRARGGSGWQLRGLMAGLGLVLGLPAAVFGWLLASLLLPVPSALTGAGLALLAGLAPAGVLALTIPEAGGRATQRLDEPKRSRARLLVEGLIVAVAAIAVFLLLRRGIDPTTVDVDPLLAGVPALLAVAVAIVALRVAPFMFRGVLALARARRGAPAFLGMARATRAASGRLIPLLALVIAVSVTVLSGVLLTSVRTGLQVQSWNTTGADLRITGPIVSPETVADVGKLTAVRAATTIADLGTANIRSGNEQRQIHLLVSDTDSLRPVQEQVPGWELPGDLGRMGERGVPAVMSEALAQQFGSDAQVVMRPDLLNLDVLGTDQSVPGTRDTSNWVLVDSDVVEEATGRSFLPRILLVDLDDDWLASSSQQDREELAQQIEDLTGPSLIEFRATDTSGQASSPAVAGLYRTLQIVMIVAASMGALTLLVSEVNAARAREQTTAVLRVLGMRRKQLAAVTAWEIGTWAVVGLVSGLTLGLVAAELATNVVDLGAFLGTEDVHTVFDLSWLGATVVGFTMIVTVTGLLAARMGRRRSAAVVLRQVEE